MTRLTAIRTFDGKRHLVEVSDIADLEEARHYVMREMKARMALILVQPRIEQQQMAA